MKKIRTLLPNDIELREADKNSKGQVHLLMYITSRSATNLLDETYGMENYNIEYVDVAGQIYCKLSIWDEEHQRYIVRMDTGEEAKIASDKSLASDALKRSIVRLGVTELYSGPAIYVNDDGYSNKGHKVLEITYDNNRNINHLVIVNRFGKEVFRWDEGQRPQVTQVPQRAAAPQNAQTDALDYVVETEMDKLKRFYQSKFRTMSPEEQKIFTEFKDFYKNKIDKSGWKGNTFDVDNLWLRWKNNNMKTQTK